jgi:histidine ammonia-lyase
MITNTRAILAIELLSAAQGIDLLAPLATSAPLQAVWRLVRAKVAVLGTDRVFGPDIDVIDELIRSGAVVAAAGAARLPSVGAA